ncbi:MAG: hypothetical protein CML61_10090 [Rhodobacteraceae bacterium]|nr:hypothetical protein [Paracoccaceae bacterium]
MNLEIMNLGQKPLTMSSREIAELCEKQHDNVMRDIRKMMQDIGKDALNFEDIYQDAYGRDKPCFILPKDLTVTLITGYRADLRYKVVKRLEELENQARAAPLPDFSDPAVLVPLLTSYAQRTQIAEGKVAELAPKAEAYSILDASEGSVNVRVAAKLLNTPERKFTAWLQANRWAFRQNGVGALQSYVEKRNCGYVEHRTHTYYDRGRGEDRTVAQLMITPKGLARLAQIFAKQGVPA